jgi:hypothetical protein
MLKISRNSWSQIIPRIQIIIFCNLSYQNKIVLSFQGWERIDFFEKVKKLVFFIDFFLFKSKKLLIL